MEKWVEVLEAEMTLVGPWTQRGSSSQRGGKARKVGRGQVPEGPYDPLTSLDFILDKPYSGEETIEVSLFLFLKGYSFQKYLFIIGYR